MQGQGGAMLAAAAAASKVAYSLGLNNRPPQQPGAEILLAYTDDDTAMYRVPPPPPPATTSVGPVGSNGTRPATAAASTPDEQHKKKPGRPHTYDIMPLAIVHPSPPEAAAPSSGSGAPSLATPTLPGGFSSGQTGAGAAAVSQLAPILALPASEGVLVLPHKKRGRPAGSRNKQHQSSNKQQPQQQKSAGGSGGVRLQAHVITVQTGEDIVSKVMSSSPNGLAVCVLSANGAISNVTLRQTGASRATVNYEGCFEILSLSGSYLLSGSDGLDSRTGGLSISLAGSDGRVLGGRVAGPLNAASPVQVVIGNFEADGRKDRKEVAVPGGNETPFPIINISSSSGTPSGSSGGPSSPANHSTGGAINNNSQLALADYPYGDKFQLSPGGSGGGIWGLIARLAQ